MQYYAYLRVICICNMYTACILYNVYDNKWDYWVVRASLNHSARVTNSSICFFLARSIVTIILAIYCMSNSNLIYAII